MVVLPQQATTVTLRERAQPGARSRERRRGAAGPARRPPTAGSRRPL